jgi:hypothetical protein
MRPVHVSARFLGLVGLLVSIFGSSWAQSGQDLPRTEEIINKAVQRAKWSEAQDYERKYAYTQLTVTEKLDGNGSVKERQERVYHVFPIQGASYYRLVQKDGKPLSAKELKQEQERERKFRQDLAQKKRPAKGDDDDDDVAFDEELVSKYHFEMKGQEQINGRSAFVLTFKPKSKDLPIKRQMDRLLNKLTGTIWIDEQEYEITRADAHLTEPVKVGLGLLAAVRKLDLLFEQMKVNDGVWLPIRVRMSIDGRYLFTSLRQKQNVQWSDFKKAA